MGSSGCLRTGIYFKEDATGDTDEEEFAAWMEGMDAIYNDAYVGTDAEDQAALEELMKYEDIATKTSQNRHFHLT